MISAACPLSPVDPAWQVAAADGSADCRPGTDADVLAVMEGYAAGKALEALAPVVAGFNARATETDRGIEAGPAAAVSPPFPGTRAVLGLLTKMFDRLKVCLRNGPQCLEKLGRKLHPFDPSACKVAAGEVYDISPDSRRGTLQFLGTMAAAQVDAARAANTAADGRGGDEGAVGMQPDRSVALVARAEEAEAESLLASQDPEVHPSIAGFALRRAEMAYAAALQADFERQVCDTEHDSMVQDAMALADAMHADRLHAASTAMGGSPSNTTDTGDGVGPAAAAAPGNADEAANEGARAEERSAQGEDVEVQSSIGDTDLIDRLAEEAMAMADAMYADNVGGGSADDAAAATAAADTTTAAAAAAASAVPNACATTDTSATLAGIGAEVAATLHSMGAVESTVSGAANAEANTGVEATGSEATGSEATGSDPPSPSTDPRDWGEDVDPAVWDLLCGRQTRIVIGDAKFLLMVEAAIEAIIAASNTADEATRTRLIRFAKTLEENAYFHGELHLMFHTTQALYRAYWPVVLEPLAVLGRRNGRSQDKGPVESFELHLGDVVEAHAATTMTLLIRLCEQHVTRGGSADEFIDEIIDSDGNLRLSALVGKLAGVVSEGSSSQVDLAICAEFRTLSAHVTAAWDGSRRFVTVFLDALTREFIAVFRGVGKTTYEGICMASVEKLSTQSPHALFLWAHNRILARMELGMLGDEGCEVYNADVKATAGKKGKLMTNAAIASDIARSRRAHSGALGISRDMGGSGGRKQTQELAEAVAALVTAGVATGGFDSLSDGVLAEVVAPSVKLASQLALTGATVTGTAVYPCTDDSGAGPSTARRKGTVAAVVYRRRDQQFCLSVDWGGGGETSQVPVSEVDVAILSEHLSTTLVNTLAGEDGASADAGNLADVLDARARTAFLVAAAGTSEHGGADAATFAVSGAARRYRVVDGTDQPGVGACIAHVFSGRNGGWYVGTLEGFECKDGTSYALVKYPDEKRKQYMHRLNPSQRTAMWEVVEPRAARTNPTSAEDTPSAAASNAVPEAVKVTEVPVGYGARVNDLVRSRRDPDRGSSSANASANANVSPGDGSDGCDSSSGRVQSMLSSAMLDKVMGERAVAQPTGPKMLAPVKVRGINVHASDLRQHGRLSLIRTGTAAKRAAILRSKIRARTEVVASVARHIRVATAAPTPVTAAEPSLERLMRAATNEAEWMSQLDSATAQLEAIVGLDDAATAADRARLGELVDEATRLQVLLNQAAGLEPDEY